MDPATVVIFVAEDQAIENGVVLHIGVKEGIELCSADKHIEEGLAIF